jgi:hypothetical protein
LGLGVKVSFEMPDSLGVSEPSNCISSHWSEKTMVV